MSAVPKRTKQNHRSINRLVAWAFYDWANSAFPTVILTFVFSSYFTSRVASSETAGSSLWGYAVGTAGIAVALLAPLLGAAIDQRGDRRRWLVAATLTCAIFTSCLWFIQPDDAYVAPAMIIFGIALISYEIAGFIYNAMLPHLAPQNRIGRWSGWGWAMGYAGGLLCLIAVLVLFVHENAVFTKMIPSQTAQHIRISFGFVALWYILFALPLLLLAPSRRARLSIRQSIKQAYQQLYESLHSARQYRHIIWFLAARMIYTDGLATIFVFGGVFAATAFDLSETHILWFGITLNISAGAGAVLFAWLDDFLGSKSVILIALVGLAVAGTVAVATHSRPVFWTAGAILGIFVGPAQSASRSYLARSAPPRLQNQMFGLYVFSGKATAFVGPLMVGLITDLTGSHRLGMGAILVLLITGFLMMTRTQPSRPDHCMQN